MHKYPFDNYLHRIAKIKATHQVLFNPFTNEYAIFPADVCRRRKRKSNWHWRYTGSEEQCQKFIKRETQSKTNLNMAEKYVHPLWQKKKNDIYNRDNWTCRCCGNSGSKHQLHVHHLYDEKNTNLWEYDDESLVTLCSGCHEKINDNGIKKLAGILAFKILTGTIDAVEFANKQEERNQNGKE